MYWKTADDRVSRFSSPAVKSKISIANQLTAHYLLSAFIILFICTTGLYWGIYQSLKSHTAAYMRDEIAVIVSFLESGDLEGLSRKIVSSSQKEYAKLYVRLVDDNRAPIIETPSMGHTIPVKAFPAPLPYNSSLIQDFHKQWIGENVYLFESILFKPKDVTWNVQIALDVSNLEHILNDYAAKIFAALIIGVFLSGLAARYIASRELRPLKAIADKTMQITAGNLGERFSSKNWPLELVSLADSLDSMMDRLQESFGRVRSYAANLAHEIRTPIGIMRGEAEIALARKRSCEEYERIIESSLEEYQRLTKIVESLLFLAMADSREVELKFEEIRIYDEIYNLQDYYDEYAQGKAFMVLCDPELVLWADATLFRRAVSNLISNAIKYSSPGGVITVEVVKKELSTEIIVSDKGNGIESGHLARLFDRFYRVPDQKVSSVKGTGLGLSIVYSIMKLHGGSVSIESTVGVGTRVTLSFPAFARNT